MSARGRPHPHLVKLSKFLVYVCRHGATSWGLQADPDGWLAIDDVHSLKPLRSAPGRAAIIQIVEDACEGRLQIDHSGTRIRAVQGHSLAIRDDSFRRVDLGTPGIPRWLIHGTDEEAFLKIRREGISPMTRQHVHLATTVDVVHDYSTVLIYVDKNEILRLGMELLLSGPATGPGKVTEGHAGVVLCRSVIPPSCFKCAWHVAKEIDLLHDRQVMTGGWRQQRSRRPLAGSRSVLANGLTSTRSGCTAATRTRSSSPSSSPPTALQPCPNASS